MRLKVRSAGGDGRRALFASVSPCDTVESLKKIVCGHPHSPCSDASSFLLVLKGKPRIAVTPHTASNACSLAGRVLCNRSTLSDAAVAPASVLTAILACAPVACKALQPPSLSELSSPTGPAPIGEGLRVRIACLQVTNIPRDV